MREGWLRRQMKRLEEEWENLPEWMRDERVHNSQAGVGASNRKGAEARTEE
jgi:hypothetical protein